MRATPLLLASLAAASLAGAERLPRAANTAPAATAPMAVSADTSRVSYKSVDVDGIKIFYREAGDASKPTLLLLHGFPSSSHVFRDLIPLLASDFHVVAPDYPGSGFSDAPAADKFDPTFANLATVVARFTRAVGLRTFTIYMQDFGGPVGFRVAAAHPDRVPGLIIQNATAYVEGVAPDQLEGMRDLATRPLTPARAAEADKRVSPNATLSFYKAGARDFGAVDPTSYSVDNWILTKPATRRIQKALVVDYYDNVLQYPRWQDYLRQYKPKTLIVWGRNDGFFLPVGAEAYRRDVPNAELHYFDTGHFALEEDAPGIAARIIATFGRRGG